MTTEPTSNTQNNEFRESSLPEIRRVKIWYDEKQNASPSGRMAAGVANNCRPGHQMISTPEKPISTAAQPRGETFSPRKTRCQQGQQNRWMKLIACASAIGMTR